MIPRNSNVAVTPQILNNGILSIVVVGLQFGPQGPIPTYVPSPDSKLVKGRPPPKERVILRPKYTSSTPRLTSGKPQPTIFSTTLAPIPSRTNQRHRMLHRLHYFCKKKNLWNRYYLVRNRNGLLS